VAVRSAVGRLRKQQEVLRRFIREDTITAVQDAAAARNVRVVFGNPGAVSDRTEQFLGWLTAGVWGRSSEKPDVGEGKRT
jgi:hypothetical protein